MKKEVFIPLFAKLCLAFGKEYNEAQAIVYYDLLKNMDEIQCGEAIKKCIYTCKFFPSVSEIISNMSDEMDVAESWQKVLYMARNGGRGWEELSDVEISTVNAIGGLNAIQDADEESTSFLFKDFIKNFPIFIKRKIIFNNDDEKRRKLNMGRESYYLNGGR